MIRHFFHEEWCKCKTCTEPPPTPLLMWKEQPSLRLVGVELEISNISRYEASLLCNLSKRNWIHKDDSSIPISGREIVSPPFKTEAGFDKAVEILTVAVNRYGGRAIYNGEESVTCDLCNGDCDCSFCNGNCGCNYCEEQKCGYCIYVRLLEEKIELLNDEEEEDWNLQRVLAWARSCLYGTPTFDTPQEYIEWAEGKCECETECSGECEGYCECEECEGSTGFHVHVDARDLTKEQREAVYVIYGHHWNEICEWHHDSRNDDNQYCTKPCFHRLEKIGSIGGERYSAVNNHSAFKMHGTIEFRHAFLPADNPAFVKEWALWCRGLVDVVASLDIKAELVGHFLNRLEEWNFKLGEPGKELPSIEQDWRPEPLAIRIEEKPKCRLALKLLQFSL